MRDGWLLQEDLSLQRELLLEADLALKLVHVLDTSRESCVQATRECLLTIADKSLEFVLWMESLMFDLPTAVMVVGASSVGKSSFIEHLFDGTPIHAAHSGTSAQSVQVYGYRAVGTATYGLSGKPTARVTLADYVEQYHPSHSHVDPMCFTDGRMWTIDRVQAIEIADIASGQGIETGNGYALGRIDAVLFLVDAGTGTPSAVDAKRLRMIGNVWPEAVVHIALVKADTVAPDRLALLTDAYRRAHGRLFAGNVFTFSNRGAEGDSPSCSRAPIARMLRQLSVDREDANVQKYRERISEHMVRRRQAFAWLEELAAQSDVPAESERYGRIKNPI